MSWQEELGTKFSERNRNILTIAKRNNYYAFSYKILRNKFALTFAYSTEKEKKEQSPGRMRTQQNADACTLWLHTSPKLSGVLSEMQADTGVREIEETTLEWRFRVLSPQKRPSNSQGDMPLPSTWQLCIFESRRY